MVQFFIVKSVDMNGYCGRENHPDPSDIGTIVRPVKMNAMLTAPGGVFEPVVGEDGRLYVDAVKPLFETEVNPNWDLDADIEVCYTCVTPDGRLLDLMEFELDAVPVDFVRYALGKTSDPRD